MALYHQHHSPVPQERRHLFRQGIHDQVLGMVMLVAAVALWAYPMAIHDGPKDAQVNEAVVGTVLTLVVGRRLYRGGSWRSDVVIGLAGLWMIASPFVLSLQKTAVDTGSTILDLAMGTVLVLAAALSLLVLRTDRRANDTESGQRLPASTRRRP
ncbi:SPW repeat domain-containing protein [Streptomyces sp. NPDC002990]